MPLTPADVANKQFKIAFRGYSLDEVDTFLDEVEGELGRLLRENAELRTAPAAMAPAYAAPAQPVAHAAPPAVPHSVPPAVPYSGPPTPGEGQEAALRTLLLAQRTADEAVREAQAEAEKIVADARVRANNVDHEIAMRISIAMGGVDERKRELEKEIEDLRAFEREYRTRLKAYLEAQLQELGRGAPDDAGAGVPAAARSAAIAGTTHAAPTVPSAPSAPPAQAVAPPAIPQSPPSAPSYTPIPPSVPPPPAPPGAAQTGADEIGPFTIVPPSMFSEHLDEGFQPPTDR